MKYGTTPAPRAKAMLELMSTGQLVTLFIETGKQIEAGHPDSNIYEVRGWIMDELERRCPDQFEAWLDSDDNEDEGILNYINC